MFFKDNILIFYRLKTIMVWYDIVRKIVVWIFWHVVIPLFALDWIMHKQELMHNIKMKMLNQTTEDLPT